MQYPDRDRQRRRTRRHGGRAARHRAGLAPRPGPDRRQGGLRRRRVRRLLGAGRPAGRRTRRHPVDGAERLPRAGARAGRPGGRHAEGLGTPGRPAPGAAGDGRPRRLPVRLLHAGIHLQHGCGVLPPGPRRGGPVRPTADSAAARRARPQRVRPARPERQPLPLHGVPADPRRRLRARRAGRRRRSRRPLHRGCRRRPRAPGCRSARPGSPGPPTSPRRSRCWPSGPTPPWWRAAPTGASRSTSGASVRRS